MPYSGTYYSKPANIPLMGATLPAEPLRLDVDGPEKLNQSTASGTFNNLAYRVHWIAALQVADADSLLGTIHTLQYPKGQPAQPFPFNKVRIDLNGAARTASVTFFNDAGQQWSMVYYYFSASFRELELEFDREQGVSPVLEYNSAAHPLRPADMPAQKVTLASVYGKAGINIKTSVGGNEVAVRTAADRIWDKAELHDAMQANWSRYSPASKWAAWVFCCSQYQENGVVKPNVSGLMFDTNPADKVQRQGAALFMRSQIFDYFAQRDAPALKEANIARHKFFTLVHEIGHVLNLTHSNEKYTGAHWNRSFMGSFSTNSPSSSLSFMNYPENYPASQDKITNHDHFFKNFKYEFSEDELMFLRHAPDDFVRPGGAAWGMSHAYEIPEEYLNQHEGLELTIRVNRPQPHFEFMEPVRVELKLKNTSSSPIEIEANALEDFHDLRLLVEREGKENNAFQNFYTADHHHQHQTLAPGEAVFENHFIGAGKQGWLMAKPGRYKLRAVLKVGATSVISNTLEVKVLPADSRDAERVAQDYFTDGVGRVLAFGGSLAQTDANNTLLDLTERLGQSKAAMHARYALAKPYLFDFKTLNFGVDGPSMQTRAANQSEALALASRLVKNANEAAETLGHLHYKRFFDHLSIALNDYGDLETAHQLQSQALDTLAARKVKSQHLVNVLK